MKSAPLQHPLKPDGQSAPQDWVSLRRHLATHGMMLDAAPAPRQFAGGLANLNYLLSIDGREHVLRRPPPGTLPPGAHDMAREARILRNLWQRFPLAPRCLHLCDDPEVIGASFQILEYRPGFTIRDTLPPAVADAPRPGERLGAMLVDILATLHHVDPADVGLADLGRPDGFLERAREGWVRRAGLVCGGNRNVDAIAAWLRAQTVPGGTATLLHNDLKLDNVVLDAGSLEPVAVLDWDQGTRGDPLFDLATLLSYWTEADDPLVMHTLGQMPTAAPGFPTRRDMVAAYAAATGRDVSAFRFHRVLAMFKLGVVYHQLHTRFREGTTSDRRYAGFGRLGDALLEFTRSIAADEVF